MLGDVLSAMVARLAARTFMLNLGVELEMREL